MTQPDPWGAPDEAQQPSNDDPWGPPPEAAKPTPPPQQAAVKTVNADSEGKIVLTFKEAGGFDASWIVVHAGSVDEALEILSDKDKFQKLMTMTKNVAGHFRGGAPSAGGGGGGKGGGGGRSGQPKAAKQPPPGTDPAPDDSYEYKSGTKNGKFWHGWFPPRGSNKDVVWLPTD
ncbi:hypothetical protein SEA_SMEADLEY_47 [Mycobacterium phage Smeadley]|uniref:Uncharacterized protein n=1 Tax=Mycobacterium phage Smeadley TaxID=1673873 RepID=A0A0H4TGU9_9CAUD|nr:ribonucleoside reductase class II [Mycobacterium phage Smeadley]AKQ07615.1 hypothetical protein SEA_SMEADLEY_47 [Mycobacterium phage Smeadley]